MASAQVLPNSKQELLQAGRRRLEEFRKKKAEGRARKPASTGQQQPTDVTPYMENTLESGSNDAAATPSDTRPINLSNNTTQLNSSSGARATSSLTDGSHNAHSGQKSVKDITTRQYQGSEVYLNSDRQEDVLNPYPSAYNGIQETQANITNESVPLNPLYGGGSKLYQSSNYTMNEAPFKEERSHRDSSTSHASLASISSEKHSDGEQRDTGFASTSVSGYASAVLKEGSFPFTTSLAESFPRAEQSNGPIVSDEGLTKFGISSNWEPHTDSAPWRSSDSLSSGFSSGFRGSSNHNRSYFLDDLNIPRALPRPQSLFTQSEKNEPFLSSNSKVHSVDTLASSAFGQPFTNNVSIGSFDKLRIPNGPDIYDDGSTSVSVGTEEEIHSQVVKDRIMKWDHKGPTVKKDENFAALEQYIEDLTQEKFSLKRDLDASRALAESLASENSSLTDSYNQQRAAVNQLKSDMESLHEEIKAQLLELDSVKMEYSNAQLECNAADERSKILASEVIGLEEKVLKLRSSELKLERQLENSNDEIASYKKKVSSLQEERQDLQFTIDGLQEEKKLLQSKVRKAAGNVKPVEAIKKNVSTSTEDLVFEVSDLVVRDMNSGFDALQTSSNNALLSGASSTLQSFPENRDLNFPVASVAIPPDQLRIIGNINSIVSELALEKEELMRALSSESSHSSRLKELNKELSRKLEVQTQRLELLTAQSMANENILERPTDSRPALDNIAYTDEGDEVVERVLGWIMKLFPGGPSKRRTRRLI